MSINFFHKKTTDADEISIESLGIATYSDLKDYFATQASTGVVSGGVITDGGSGTVDVSAGTIYIRSSDSEVADIYSANFSSSTGLVIVDDALNYIYVEYNSGTPQIVTSTTLLTDFNSNVLLGFVYRLGSELHITNGKNFPQQLASRVGKRLIFVDGLTRQSGAIISETGTRNIAITAGTWWLGLNEYTTTAVDTSAASTFTYYYEDGLGGWTAVTGQTQIDNTQYDDGSGTLATLTNGRYGVHWVYRGVDDDVYVLYGTDDATLSVASEAVPPSNRPGHLNNFHSALIGKIVIRKGESSFTTIQNPFDDSFGLGVADDHSDLSTLDWLNSGHTGNANKIAAFDGSGLATEITDNSATWDSLVSNATHTGEVTGATTLTVDPTAISNRTEVTPVSGDYFLYLDATDGALKKADFDDLGGGGSGDVVGPASAVQYNLPSFGDTTGKLLQDSGMLVYTSGTQNNFLASASVVTTGSYNTAYGSLTNVVAGNTSENTAMGAGANAYGGECSAFGRGATASGLRCTAIGETASASADNCVAIGRTAVASVAGCTAVGVGASATGGSNNFALGRLSSVSGTAGNSTAVGYNTSINSSGNQTLVMGSSASSTAAANIVIGGSASSAHNFALVFGYQATSTTTNQVVFGSGGGQINYFVVGKGDLHASPTEVVHRSTSGTGTNINGANYVVEPGRPTGSGSSGSFIVRTASPGASGTTLRTSADRFTVDTNSNIFCGTASALGTTATEGFLHIPSCAGTPTGTPGTTKTGLVPLVVDTTNGKLYGYFGAAWNDLTGA